MMGLAWGVCCLLVLVAAAGTRAGVTRPPASHTIDTPEYLQHRQALLAQEHNDILGQDQVLSAEEEEANKILMSAKDAEMEDAFHTLDFLPSKNFMTVIQQMEESQVFKIIKQMPKGAALHLHHSAMGSSSWVVQELTYWPHLYMCYDTDDNLFFRFFEEPDTSCAWELVSAVRSNYVDPSEFDAMLFSRLSLITEDPDEKYPDIDTAWSSFYGYFATIGDLITYRPAWEAYLYHALGEFADDNVMYMEFRSSLAPLYELNGTKLTQEESVAVYRDTTQRFVDDNKGRFFGARFIYAPSRGVDNATVQEYVSLMKRLKAAFPDFVAGFDLVGQEDKGEPLIAFVDELLQLSEADIRVFYHAGETNWMGMESDDNLIDALLLNASRIGHGYALVKHPEAKMLAQEKDVPLEVCPISNQVLKLVEDLRNHPAAALVAEGFPIVVSADDPGAWGASGLSYDMYEAFMAFGGAKADLRFLKQLAINSIKYSSLGEAAENDLMHMWLEKWNEFVAKAPTFSLTETDYHTSPHSSTSSTNT